MSARQSRLCCLGENNYCVLEWWTTFNYGDQTVFIRNLTYTLLLIISEYLITDDSQIADNYSLVFGWCWYWPHSKMWNDFVYIDGCMGDGLPVNLSGSYGIIYSALNTNNRSASLEPTHDSVVYNCLEADGSLPVRLLGILLCAYLPPENEIPRLKEFEKVLFLVFFSINGSSSD